MTLVYASRSDIAVQGFATPSAMLCLYTISVLQSLLIQPTELTIIWTYHLFVSKAFGCAAELFQCHSNASMQAQCFVLSWVPTQVMQPQHNHVPEDGRNIIVDSLPAGRDAGTCTEEGTYPGYLGKGQVF